MDFASSFKSKLLDALEDLEEKKMDPVGQADDDIDNDGDVDIQTSIFTNAVKLLKRL